MLVSLFLYERDFMARWNHPTKNKMRDLALQFSGTSSAALLFPGEELRCVKQGLKTGLFDSDNTTLICIEKDPAIASNINAKLKALGFKNFYLHKDDASTLTVRRMENVLGTKKIDFAFFDFCNTLNEDTAYWLARDCKSIFQNNARVSFTFALRTLSQRHNYLEKIETDKIYPCLRIDPSVVHYEPNFSIYKDDPKTTLVGIWLAMSVNYSFKIIGVDGYNTTGNPMILVRTDIANNKSSIENKYFWDLIHNDTVIRACVPHAKQVSRQIGCHPIMPKDLQMHFVHKAKMGVRPPWINPAEWAWHPVNPNGQSNRRKVV
jgi:predicted RNA methylase